MNDFLIMNEIGIEVCRVTNKSKSHAKLIASAPELLEALIKVKCALDNSTEVDRKYWSKQIDKAIKKATE